MPTRPDFFSPIKRERLRLTEQRLVKNGYLDADRMFPLVLEPDIEGVNLIAWASHNRPLIEIELAKHGAILFRNFNLKTAEEFEQVIAVTSGAVMEYRERSSPRSQVHGNIYTSTDHPADQRIFLHNEQSYNLTFPQKIFFFCLTPAESGGETPIADCRKVFNALSPTIRDRFLEKGYRYVRNFGNGPGLTWQTAFRTEDPSAVEDYCKRNEIDFEWKPGSRLKTQQLRCAAARHPKTAEMVWFNHLTFFHVSTLEPRVRETILAELGEDDLPNNTYYGDGMAIEPETLDELRRAYSDQQVSFAWRQGDLLMLDNMLSAHGRLPFSGRRKVVVGMADPLSWKNL